MTFFWYAHLHNDVLVTFCVRMYVCMICFTMYNVYIYIFFTLAFALIFSDKRCFDLSGIHHILHIIIYIYITNTANHRAGQEPPIALGHPG